MSSVLELSPEQRALNRRRLAELRHQMGIERTEPDIAGHVWSMLGQRDRQLVCAAAKLDRRLADVRWQSMDPAKREQLRDPIARLASAGRRFAKAQAAAVRNGRARAAVQGTMGLHSRENPK